MKKLVLFLFPLYIHAQDVADGLMFILNLKNYSHKGDFGNAKCPKFNLVGPEEIDNLSLAEKIANAQNKKLTTTNVIWVVM